MKKIVRETFILSMSPTNKPVETIASGETVLFETYDCFSNEIKSDKDLFHTVGWDKINPATGPVFVKGASPGDTIKIDILDIKIAHQGVMSITPEMGALAGCFAQEKTKIISIKEGMAVFNETLQLPINPMIGVIGTAPLDEDVPTGTPKDHGGNMDCKRIRKGATLYLPVNVNGALLAMGDAHAVMGDGEVVICGLEIPAEITVKVTVIKGQPYPLPFLADDEYVMTIASSETLDEASKRATKNMHTFLVNEVKMEEHEAAMFLSLGADLKICQIVDPLMTARMELPTWVLEKYNYKLV
ncbi:acetamidase [Virgibacillus pantothenticus]|uniref:acetamidase/formamidase family protein n=1 Tax=Virgibacillus pantothenticus TaxID=1473 RepID=UPI001B0F1D08|nr:acetamidase/formamidase family protein [Virgibacillus pantothenticus]GIP62615.1 acetamidase [Virgibacillus pantothenticus]